MAVQVETEPSLSSSTARVLFCIDGYSFPNAARRYDLSPDGTPFLMLKPDVAQTSDDEASPGLVLVLDWFEELARLASTGR